MTIMLAGAAMPDHLFTHSMRTMPPDYALSSVQRETLVRWVEQGAPKGERSNRAPVVEQIAPVDLTDADRTTISR